MNLLDLVPQKIAVAVVTVLVSVAAGFGLGAKYVYGRWIDSKAAEAVAEVKIVTRQGTVTERVVTEYQEKVVTRKGTTNTIEKEVKVYVESKPLTLACMLDMRWMRLHDAAAVGAVPPPASDTDAAPGTITVAGALPIVTSNYATCGRNADRLEALQGWVRGQFESTNGQPLRW